MEAAGVRAHPQPHRIEAEEETPEGVIEALPAGRDSMLQLVDCRRLSWLTELHTPTSLL